MPPFAYPLLITPGFSGVRVHWQDDETVQG
jgi:hypothetical protein